MEIPYNEKSWWIDDAELSAFVQRVTNSVSTATPQEETESTETIAKPEEPNFFAFDKSLQAYLVDFRDTEGIGAVGKAYITMTDEEKQILLNLLKPYADTISGDVLKCDYLHYYSIEIDDRMTLTIDPELGNYGENGDSYMLVMEHRPGAYIKGTYIDAELVNYLAECLEQTNGV